MTKITEQAILETQLLSYVSREVIRRKVKAAVDTPLVQSGLIDSLGLLQIIAYIETEYGVNLAESGGPRDFGSISSLAAAICRIRSAQAA